MSLNGRDETKETGKTLQPNIWYVAALIAPTMVSGWGLKQPHHITISHSRGAIISHKHLLYVFKASNLNINISTYSFAAVDMLPTVSAKKLPPVTRLQAKTTARMRAEVRPKILGIDGVTINA